MPTPRKPLIDPREPPSGKDALLARLCARHADAEAEPYSLTRRLSALADAAAETGLEDQDIASLARLYVTASRAVLEMETWVGIRALDEREELAAYAALRSAAA